MKQIIFTSIFFLGLLQSSFSQIVTGGTISADYRNDGYYIEIAPKIGYKYSIFESGAAPFISYQERTNYLVFGLQIYTQATIFKGAFLHAEFQAANAFIVTENNRQWVLGLPIGVGYQQEISKNVWVKGSILYDVLYKDGFSPQKNPIIRFGVTYSL